MDKEKSIKESIFIRRINGKYCRSRIILYIYQKLLIMPIPKPKANESRKDFIVRCMSDKIMVNEYPDKDQRLAVCSTQFKNK